MFFRLYHTSYFFCYLLPEMLFLRPEMSTFSALIQKSLQNNFFLTYLYYKRSHLMEGAFALNRTKNVSNRHIY